ncbi:hypothetical protein LOZ80_17150 [Paenibacillus sp. HWE-109]|uniref:tetratricopeptide repeat protein n=1 Tax=Paenibacillus sp. HWE-109 TaxID=1306526 RepID=UPI001EDD872D|nr:hypothetical protein [Paenibacillus sp. HWE-109]UKS30573.1 hypothetical protein LOZ80_17150 [Paenibacillus sp. HWE-109]
MNGEDQIQKAYESILGHDFEKAIEWFEKAIAAEPDNAAYHYKLSITFARSNKLFQAIEHASKALDLEKDNEVYRYHLQVLHARELVDRAQKEISAKSEHGERAIFLLKEAIVLDPLAIEAYLILGEVFALRNDYSRGYQVVMDALRLEPNHELAKQQAARYQLKLKL